MTYEININTELMSMEQLDAVAGGTYRETAADTRFLHDLARLCNRFSATMSLFDGVNDCKVINAAKSGWNKIGIRFEQGFTIFDDNRYYLGGKEITRQQAFNYACQKYGKKLQDMPGDYNF